MTEVNDMHICKQIVVDFPLADLGLNTDSITTNGLQDLLTPAFPLGGNMFN